MKQSEVIKHLKFPFQFDEQKLVADLSKVLAENWTAHYNTMGYTGNWSGVSLYAKNGDEQNIIASVGDHSELSETSLMKNCDYFREVVSYFQFPILSVRLLRLEAGAEIKPHTDLELGYEDGEFRLHIPIVTNPEVYFVLDDERLEMFPGECWYTNVNFTHSVANRGTEDRVHLVIDGVRNAWSDELFFAQASPDKFEKNREENHSVETLKRMLEELKSRPEMADHPLIESLEALIYNAQCSVKNRINKI